MAFADKKAAARYVNEYKRANYDRIGLLVPKGQKDKLKAAADAQGKSLNQYISDAIKMYGRVSGSQ